VKALHSVSEIAMIAGRLRRAAAPVGEARDGDAEEGVEDHEDRAGQQAHLRVLDVQFVLDRLDQDREHLPIQVAQGVGDHQQGEDVATLADIERRRNGRPRVVDRRGDLDHVAVSPNRA
jgi:hypothetical protein